MKYPLSSIAIFLGGFGIAWWVKPDAASAGTASTLPPPVRTRIERPDRHILAKPAMDRFFHRIYEAGSDRDKHRAVIDELTPAEIPALLAELQTRAGMGGLDQADQQLVDELLTAWHAKAPDAAVAWVLALRNDKDSKGLLGKIAMHLAATDLDAALTLLRENSTPGSDLISDNTGIFQIALAQGEDKFLEVCRQCLSRRGMTTGVSLIYPADFDFQRVLNGLADAKVAFGEGGQFGVMPNFIGEWAKRDSIAAWEWLQQGKKLIWNDANSFLSGYAMVAKPEDLADFIATNMEPKMPPADRYSAAWGYLNWTRESPETLDRYLQASTGDRTTHLLGLFDQSYLVDSTFPGIALPGIQVSCFNGQSTGEKVFALLERMDPATRVLALQRKYAVNGVNEPIRNALTPVLLELGHSAEEIKSLLPPSKQ